MNSSPRKHRKTLAAGLVSLLLATWLSMFCGACMAGTLAPGTLAPGARHAAMPCHDHQQPGRHGCCGHPGDCLKLALPDAATGDGWSLLPHTPDWTALVVLAPDPGTPVGEPADLLPLVTGPPAAPDTPAYLRFCSLVI